MANFEDSFSDNVPGAWYVDGQCIICGLCENVAPQLFRASPGYDHNLVYRQPVTPEELADAENARDRCPAEAIGNDRPEAASLPVAASK